MHSFSGRPKEKAPIHAVLYSLPYKFDMMNDDDDNDNDGEGGDSYDNDSLII